jgi:adenylyltransferase/sulfurtransferase
VKQITPAQLKEWMEQNHDFVLVDVREDFERELFNIGGLHIPMSELAARFREIPADKDVVLYCEKGIRSVIAIQRLEGAGWHNLINLAGGMKHWKETV